MYPTPTPENHEFYTSTFPKPYMVSRIFTQMCQKIYLVPRVFSQKGNGVSIFGHRFCPFSGNFLTLVQMKNKK
jgi:hypothetical protein